MSRVDIDERLNHRDEGDKAGLPRWMVCLQGESGGDDAASGQTRSWDQSCAGAGGVKEQVSVAGGAERAV